MSSWQDSLYSEGILAGDPLEGFSGDDEFGTGLCLNFESNRIAIGAPGNTSSTGYVTIYDYSENTNAWSLNNIITGPHTNSRFGQSVSLNWEGDRVVIGANAASNVYIYDLDGGNWNLSNIIQSSSNSFGECVSLACERNNRICIGAPVDNTIFVYEERNGVWDLDFSNVGTDIPNIVPHTDTEYIRVNDEYTGYGTFVQMSAFGNHIIVGAPGTRLTNIDTTNSNATTSYNCHVETEFGDVGSYQLGSARIFECSSNWTSGVIQKGQVLQEDAGGILVDSFWDPRVRSLPGYGKVVQITPDGNIVAVSAPEYGVNPDIPPTGTDRFKGRIYLYEYNALNEVWNKINRDIPGELQNRIGTGMSLSYDGSRIAYTSNNQEFLIDIVDWSGTEWYELTTPIKRTDLVYSLNYNSGYIASITNGKISSTSAPLKGAGFVYNHKHLLSSTFEGNSIFGGYIKADTVYVGANNDLTTPKKLLFGGTLGDNEHFATSIEARTFDEDFKGSEMLIMKMPGELQYDRIHDRIRMKADDIIFDTFNSKQHYIEPRYQENHRMYINKFKCIGVNIGSLYDAKNHMDINGDSLVRSKFIVGENGKYMNWNAHVLSNDETNQKHGTFLFYNTRSNVLADSSNVQTTVFSQYWQNESNGIPTNVIYSQDHKSILFSGTSSNVQTRNYKVGFDEFFNTYSVWLKPTNISSTYERVLNINDQYKVEINNSNVKTIVGINTKTIAQTFKNNIWYHLFLDFKRNGSNEIDKSNIYINNSLIFYDSNAISYTTFTNTIVLGDGFNGYMGTPIFSTGAPQHVDELYEYGPPIECFSFNGSGVIDGYIKNQNPRFYASNTSTSLSSGITTTGAVNVLDATTTNTGNYYDTSTGIFTARINGSYYFEFQGLLRWVSVNGSCDINFLKNGTEISGYGISTGRVTSASNRDTVTANMIIDLVSGDTIQPYIKSIDTGIELFYGDGYSHFMGYFMG